MNKISTIYLTPTAISSVIQIFSMNIYRIYLKLYQLRLSAPQVLLWCPPLLGLGAQRPRVWVSMSVCVSATAPHKSAYRN